MSKTIWDRFAPIYSLTMKSQKNIYDYMYKHIADAVMGKKSKGWKITASQVVPGRIDLM